MTLTLLIRREAERDIAEAFRWYADRKVTLGEDFLACLDAAFERIRGNPRLPAEVYRRVRRVLLHRFPYGVYYIIEAESVVVLAVFHGRRDPIAWRRRAGPDAEKSG